MAATNPSLSRDALPDDDDLCVQSIEVAFAIPVYITIDQQQRLNAVLSEIARRPQNQPTGCVHWVSGVGHKPQWSRADAAFLGVPADPSAPASGEPTFDDDVLHFETTCRERYPSESPRVTT